MLKRQHLYEYFVYATATGHILSRNIQFYRKQHDLTQMQLSMITGLARSYLAEIETGSRNPTISKIYQISIGLRIEPWRLLKLISYQEWIYGQENNFTSFDLTLPDSKMLSIHEYRNIFIKHIKYLRGKSNWKQQDLANSSNLSVSFIQALEQGRKEPTLESVEKLASAFNIPAWQLIKGIDPNYIWFKSDMWH